jgi:hypothetical protein
MIITRESITKEKYIKIMIINYTLKTTPLSSSNKAMYENSKSKNLLLRSCSEIDPVLTSYILSANCLYTFRMNYWIY